jgi:hypothetical protein
MARARQTIQLGAMRASDADRQRAVEELRLHCAAGRIDVDEFGARIEAALAAVTIEELDEIRADLPVLPVPDPSGPFREGIVGPPPDGPGERPTVGRRASALLVALLTVSVVLVAIVLSLVAEWTWAIVLLGGWVAGALQGRVANRRGWSR